MDNNIKIERIAGTKPVNSKGRELVIVTTITGQTVWATKGQYVEGSQTISYVTLPKGTVYKKRDNTEGTLENDRNELVGCGKLTSIDVMDHLLSKGVTPMFAAA